MVLDAIRDYFSGPPTLPPGPVKLPKHFPLVPVGCEAKSDALFHCIGGIATDKLRELEKDDGGSKAKSYIENHGNVQPEDDPLEPCRELVAHYKRCLDRNIYKRKNERLTEFYRVQEEYRYQTPDVTGGYVKK